MKEIKAYIRPDRLVQGVYLNHEKRKRKLNTMKSTLIAAAIAIAGLLQSATLFAQDPGEMKGMDKQKHREMMPTHAKMMEEQKMQDVAIDKLVAEMNAATGEEKRVDAIIAVVNKLIEQRKAMHERWRRTSTGNNRPLH